METPNSMLRGCVTKLALEIEGQLDIFISNRRVRAAKTYVPVELCSEILSRLPVKSLLRFRCVSKSWRSLIDDPQFCDLHFKAFQNNSHENHLLIVETNKKSHQLSILIVCKQTLEKTKLISALAGMDRETPETWYAWSAVDGLLFLRNKCLDVMLWNPSIRRCRRIPGVVADADLGPLFSRPYGVGFDPVSHDYKYVKLFYRHGRPRVGVYSVGTNSWESRQLLPWEEDLCTNCNGYRSRRVNLRGSFYYAKNQELLVSFSFSTMVFTHQSLPLAMSDERIWLLLGLIDGGSTLAAIGQPWRGPGDCIIWALETSSTLMMNSGGVSVRWTKRYTISTQCLTLFPTSGCHVVFHRHDDAIRKQLLVSYNIETQEERIIQSNCSQWIPFVRVYKESLVLLN